MQWQSPGSHLTEVVDRMSYEPFVRTKIRQERDESHGRCGYTQCKFKSGLCMLTALYILTDHTFVAYSAIQPNYCPRYYTADVRGQSVSSVRASSITRTSSHCTTLTVRKPHGFIV